MSSWSDVHGPPRKKMRKGTKSCIECKLVISSQIVVDIDFLIPGRRRKIRCTYTDEHPSVCKECRLRGSKCIDQESHEDDHGISASVQGDQRYSLRERVAHLENVVQDLAKRLDQQSMTASSPGKQPIMPFSIKSPYNRPNYLPIGPSASQALIRCL